jgi:hypothetical protein
LSKITLSGNASGTGTFTIASPNSNTDRTLNLPDAAGTIQVSGNPISGTTGSFSGDLSFNSGYGSAAVAYGCRAWVNFDGTTTPPTIRASGNVSSITRSATGEFQMNFTTAMPDANYSLVGTTNDNAGLVSTLGGTYSTTSARVYTSVTLNGAAANWSRTTVAVFR